MKDRCWYSASVMERWFHTIISRLTSRNIELLVEMEKKGTVTAREQETYVVFAFYLNIGTLKRYGLVEETGDIGDNGRKYWVLTGHGRKLVWHIKQIEEVLSHGEKCEKKKKEQGKRERD